MLIYAYNSVEYDPTIENTYRKQMDVDGVVCMLDILDTAGQEEYSAMRDQYIRAGEGFLLVCSLISIGTFQELDDLRDRILMVKDTDAFPMVVCGNKCDLEDQREVTIEQIDNIGKTFGCPTFLTSAKQRVNVDECFAGVVREIRKANGANEQPKKIAKRRGACALL